MDVICYNWQAQQLRIWMARVEQSMNNLWIKLSKQSNTAILSERLCYLDIHEIWLDSMNLHETSWMLFADEDAHQNESFGWPSIN